ncbi:oligoribonuclease [Hahella sp. CCB-MM4]|uniref:oligoribonuclease n=1 Tax=Hahella sp. (strain CCB-MM4) TaxID=1926491 RepID=UPI000B9C65F6|nr:oligoribonuclease [Hahella sp. CCB-MM4]OZG71529.1 oligoribonuclease [Hahella sp. CCB-MM4]
MSRRDNLIWIDLEMTGLDPEMDRIIEMAVIVTTSDLEVVAEGPVIAVHQPDFVLSLMDDWNQKTHGESGLVERVKQSKTSELLAEQQVLDFLNEHCDAGTSPMCGNSIGQDRRFLARYMKSLESFFHYRNLDVSTLKELARRWHPDVAAGVKKKGTHQALDDIRESIEELKYYREHFLKLK